MQFEKVTRRSGAVPIEWRQVPFETFAACPASSASLQHREGIVMANFWTKWIGPSKSTKTLSRRRVSVQRRLRAETLETRKMMAANIFHNEAMPEDVNQDGIVSALDALTIINQMNRNSAGGEAQGLNAEVDLGRGRGRMTDVNNDGRNSALDALMVINRLNRERGQFDRPGTPTDNPVQPGETPVIEDPVTEEPVLEDPAVAEANADPVLLWNDVFGEVLADSTENQNPGYASRSNAILNLAIFDSVALASGNAEGTFYEYDASVSGVAGNISAEIAATGAAHTVLSGLYPDQQAQLDAALEAFLAAIDSRADVAESLALGQQVADQILALRVDDGSDVVGNYSYTDEIGYFQPDPLNPDVPAWGPAWREVETFAIESIGDFVPATTPALDSEEYAASYNEVVALGSVDSTERTADQTEAGIFWAYDREGLGTPLALFGDVLESVATQQGNTFEENVALFAQASVAMADAAIVAWETKFSEEFWRPVTAIHQGDADGNELTEGDAEWTALGAPDGGDDIIGFTPQFPTYISGHATFGGALFGTLQAFYGTDNISFDLASEELEILLDNPDLQEAYGLDLDDATRTFNSFSEAMIENGRSRVYLGIHFDFDDLVGQEVGQAIAASVAEDFAALNDSADSSKSTWMISGIVAAAPDSGRSDDVSSRIVSDLDLNLLANDQVDRVAGNSDGHAHGNGRHSDGRQSSGASNRNMRGGIEGITLELLNDSGEVIDQTTTDDRGRFSFDLIEEAGEYQVRVTPSDDWIVLGNDIRDVLLNELRDEHRGFVFQLASA